MGKIKFSDLFLLFNGNNDFRQMLQFSSVAFTLLLSSFFLQKGSVASFPIALWMTHGKIRLSHSLSKTYQPFSGYLKPEKISIL